MTDQPPKPPAGELQHIGRSYPVPAGMKRVRGNKLARRVLRAGMKNVPLRLRRGLAISR